jgi:hypothetical protein
MEEVKDVKEVEKGFGSAIECTDQVDRRRFPCDL